MKNLFIETETTIARNGATLDNGEAMLLYRLASQITRDQLRAFGFTDDESRVIEGWMDDYTR